MPTRPNDNWSLIDSCRETRGESATNAKICLGRSGRDVRASKNDVCVKPRSYMRSHETAVADNWSAVGGTAIGRNRLPPISLVLLARSINLEKIDYEEHIKECNFHCELKGMIIKIVIIIITIISYI